jgi:hypothetical protein
MNNDNNDDVLANDSDAAIIAAVLTPKQRATVRARLEKRRNERSAMWDAHKRSFNATQTPNCILIMLLFLTISLCISMIWMYS